MRIYRIKAVALGLTLAVAVTSCDSFENPNAATEESTLTTVNGLRALAIGMKREYQINSLDIVIRAAGCSAREFGVAVGFTNPLDLEAGGSEVRSDNGIPAGIWSSSYRIMAMAEDLISSTGSVVQEEATRNALIAMGHLFKGITLGNLYMFWERFPDAVDIEGNAEFVDRVGALETAIDNLEAGRSLLGSGSVPASFRSDVLGTDRFDLRAVLNAYLARYYGFLGRHAEAIAAADRALAASTVSEWRYETGGGNVNPMWDETVDEPATYKPLDNFGIDPAEYVVPDQDGRKAFYLAQDDTVALVSLLPVEAMRGFFATQTSAIPVFLPGEMHLIKAEALARSGDLNGAVAALNAVRTKTDDPWGVNAGLPAYSGPTTAAAILNDIYLNRRVELYLIGTSLEDSRRFDRPRQPSPPDYTSFDRNREYYPYPDNERSNNPNTPADPAI